MKNESKNSKSNLYKSIIGIIALLAIVFGYLIYNGIILDFFRNKNELTCTQSKYVDKHDIGTVMKATVTSEVKLQFNDNSVELRNNDVFKFDNQSNYNEWKDFLQAEEALIDRNNLPEYATIIEYEYNDANKIIKSFTTEKNGNNSFDYWKNHFIEKGYKCE